MVSGAVVVSRCLVNTFPNLFADEIRKKALTTETRVRLNVVSTLCNLFSILDNGFKKFRPNKFEQH